MGRSRLLVHDVATALALAAMLAAPLRVASADDGPSAEAPAPAPTTAEPPAPAPAPAPAEAAPAEQTPEERAKALGWDDESTEQPAEPVPEPPEETDEEEDDDDEPDVGDVIDADPVLAKDYRKARSMAIGGGATAAVGIVLVASGAYFVAAESISRDSAGQVSSEARLIGGWVTMGIGLAALTAGVVVMALGLTKRKRVVTEAEARMPPTASVSPWFGKRSGGLALSLRF